MKCTNCSTDISNSQERFCPTCGHDIGYPHIREVCQVDEIEALERRYQQAKSNAEVNKTAQALNKFENYVKNACAIINTDIDFLHHFVKSDNALNSKYGLQVKGQMRKPAEKQNDHNRKIAEAILFGSYGENIRYAALSIDGSGVKSYGPFAIKLRNIAIENRTVLLENNSFDFIKERRLTIGDSIPAGYRATWEEKYKLGAAKHADEIIADLTIEDCAGILLFSEGNYDTDRFIEVHIYGAFDNNAIESVQGKSSLRKKAEAAMLEVAKEYLDKAGKNWIEE